MTVARVGSGTPTDDFFARLDAAPMTPARYVAWALAGAGPFLDGFAVVSLGIALPLLKRDFAMTPLLVGLIGAGLVLGAVAGSLFGGAAADRFGRRPVLLAAMFLVALGSLLGAAAGSPHVMVLAQLILGAGIGIDFPTGASYVSELMPRRVRSRMVVATIALQSAGMVCAGLAGMAILGLHPTNADWRMLIGTAGGLALLVLIARLTLPESPHWLVERGRVPAALKVLRQLGDPPPPDAVAPPVMAGARGDSMAFRHLFQRRYLAPLLLVSVPWLLMDVATYGVGLFTPVILGAVHVGGDAAPGSIAAVFADAEASALIDLFLLVGFGLALWAVPRFGRIRMQVLGFAGMAAGMLVLLAAVAGVAPPQLRVPLIVAGFVMFNVAMNAGPNATTFGLAPMLFPTALRGSAAGFAAASAKLGATFGTFVVPQLQAAWGVAGVLTLMVGVSLGGLVVTATLARSVHEDA
jgi:MFS family permease